MFSEVSFSQIMHIDTNIWKQALLKEAEIISLMILKYKRLETERQAATHTRSRQGQIQE